MTKEQKFYNALRDLFIGAKIEGKGGFVNLMRIKSSYYSKIREHLEKDINKALEKYPKFREELFDKLYSFFNRYFSKSGSIYFNYTPLFQNVYDKVYTDDKDVILFWKTHMLYYVKSDRILNNLSVEFEEKDKNYKFFFDTSKIEYKKANEKKSLVYQFKNIRKDGTIVFEVFYSERGTKTKIDEIKRELKKKGIKITDEILERAFRTFERQSEVDYFINKDAESFLKEQFKTWLYQYVFAEESEWPKERIDQLQILKDIAYKIIDFIAQFEDELVKIWEKPKFVLNSNYVITLDRICERSISKKDWQIFPSERGVDAEGGRGVSDKVVKWNELPYNPKLKEKARQLRKAGNLSEVLLWKKLKNKQLLGLDFDRQKIIGNYIVDFYCKNLGVVIEIDGISHSGKIEYDKKRDKYLRGLGLKVIHILDLEVKKNLEGVVGYLKSRLNTPSLQDTSLREGNTPSFQDTPLREGNTPSLRDTPLREGNTPSLRDTPLREGNTPSLRDTPLREGNCDGVALIEKIQKHKGWKKQVKEWKELGILEKEPKNLFENTLTGKQLKKEYQFLPIDTKYFKDLELEILNLFDNLDKSLDGWLIKSENWQALNTILPKFKEKIQTIYIDPPFNKEQEADYFYSVKFKDATWITMLENRLKLARDLLKDTGSIFVRCDYNGNMYVRLLMNEIFGEEDFRNEIVVNRIVKKGFGADRFPTAIDSLFYFVKSEKFMFKGYRKFLDKPKEPWWHDMTSMTAGRRGGEPRIIFGKKLFPPPGRAWTFSQDRINEMEKEGKIRIRCSVCGYTHYKGKWTKCPKCGEEKERVDYLVISDGREPIDNDWTDIPGYSFGWDFQTENSEILLKRVIESTSNEGDLVLDFFLGSGTTTAVAHKLGRKWLGVEMGEHFYSVVLPRMKKVLTYDKSGISKEKDVKEKYNQQKAGGFFKYYELEQYEDALRETKYEDSNLFEIPNQSPYQFNPFIKDKKLLEKTLEIDYKNNKVKVDLSKLYPDIDIAETLSNLRGKYIKKISKNEIEFEDSEKVDIKNLDYRMIKDLIWW